MLAGDASATCALVGDFSLGTSYGSIPCNMCPVSEPVCLVTQMSSSSSGNGAVGTCSCMQEGLSLQKCSRRDLSLRVVPDASQLCAVSLHTGASSRSVSVLYEWNFLAAAPCIMISMSNAYCYDVSRYGLMVVGHGVVGDTERIALLDRLGTAVSGGGSRRLLGDDSSGGSRRERWIDDALEDVLSFGDTWNHTASPCNELVGAFIESPSSFHGGGGVLDRMGLVKCIRWRKTGRDLIHALNLTSMMAGRHESGDDGRVDCCSHVFMSVLDFVSVVARNKGAGAQLLAHLPKVVSGVMNASDGFRPVAELMGIARQHAIMMYVEHLLSMYQQGDTPAGNSSRSQYGVPRPESIINATLASMDEQTRRRALRFFREHARDVSLFYVYSNSIIGAGSGGVPADVPGAANDLS